MKGRIRPPHGVGVTVLLRDGKVPVGVQGDTRCKRRRSHVNMGDNDEAEQDLSSQMRPFEGEEVNVENEDGQFRKA